MLSEYFEGPELNRTIRHLSTILIHAVTDPDHLPCIYPELHTYTGILSMAIHFAEEDSRKPNR